MSTLDAPVCELDKPPLGWFIQFVILSHITLSQFWEYTVNQYKLALKHQWEPLQLLQLDWTLWGPSKNGDICS